LNIVADPEGLASLLRRQRALCCCFRIAVQRHPSAIDSVSTGQPFTLAVQVIGTRVA
jgi:hypothetical protein